jgi:hypothetical protein
LGSAYLDSTGAWWRHNGITWQPLTTDPDSAIWATNYYVDSGLASISAGAVDTNNYISSITRLNREIDSVSNIIDSNNTIIYGSISSLYDTLPYYVTYNNATQDINLNNKNISNVSKYNNIRLISTDSSTIYVNNGATFTVSDDAVISGTNTGDQDLSGLVPYTGATGNVDLGTHTISAYNGVINHVSGSGTALSVTKGGSGEALTVTKTSGSGNAMSVSGGVTQLSELHTTTAIADAYIASAATWNAKGTVNSVATGFGVTGGTITNTGTISADSTELATRARVKKQIDSVAALSGGGTVTSIQLVGGTNVTITPTTAITTSGVYTISATGGGSSTIVKANEFNMLYKANGDTTIRGTTKVRVDTTDLRIEFAYDSTTSTVTTDPHGGVKFWGSNRMGMGAIRINDTVSIPAALQRAINAQNTSQILPLASITYTNTFTIGGLMAVFGTQSVEYAAPNFTIQNKNYNKVIITTAAPANSRAGIRVGLTNSAPGIICGNTKFSGGGGRGTFTFCLPTYDGVQGIFMGYTALSSEPSTEPSTFLNSNRGLGIGKDATDGTLFFFHSSNVAVVPTKVNTGITPNTEDVYRLTVYIAPNSTYYMQLEVLSKTNPTRVVTINPTTNIPPVGSRLLMMHYVNKLAAAGTVQLGIIQSTEEIY